MEEQAARDFGQEVGAIFREARLRKNFKMETLASIAETSKTLVSAVENGAQIPRGDTLIRLMGALDLTLADLPDEYYGFYRARAAGVTDLFTARPPELLGRRATFPASEPARKSGAAKRVSSRSSRSSLTNASSLAGSKRKRGE